MNDKRFVAFFAVAIAVVAVVGLAIAFAGFADDSKSAQSQDETLSGEYPQSHNESAEGESDSGSAQFEQAGIKGVIDPNDYDTEEEYQAALIASVEKQADVPKEPVSEKTADEEFDHGYYRGNIGMSFEFDVGEQRAREIVDELGGVWVSDTFSFSSSEEIGWAIVSLYFPEAQEKYELEEISDRLMAYDGVLNAGPSTWFEGYGSVEAQSCSDSLSSLLGGNQERDVSYPEYTNDPMLSLQSWVQRSSFGQAWNYSTCSHDVEVAVLDSGIDLNHPDLVENIAATMPFDAYNQTVLRGSEQDTNGHGTRVAGIISAVSDNGIGICGGSYNAKIIPVRVNSTGRNVDPEAVCRALAYVTSLSNTPEVVNMSFAGNRSAWGTWFSEMRSLVIKARNDFGIVCVAASGNSGKSELLYPAAFQEVLSVGSISATGSRSSFSTTNSMVDMCALGEDVLSTANPDYEGREYGTDSGTSFAAPQVAAAAALIAAKYPMNTPTDIECALVGTLIDKPGSSTASCRSDGYGYGALNAGSAAKLVRPRTVAYLYAVDSDGTGYFFTPGL